MTTDAVEAPEVSEQEDAAFADAFNAAMGNEPVVEEKAPEAAAPVVEEAPKTEAAPAQEAKPAEPEQTVTLTNDEVKSLLSRLDQIDSLQKQLHAVNGKYGAMNDTIAKLKEARAAGGTADISDEDLAALGDFGELKDSLKTVFKNVLPKLGGGGSVDLTPVEAKFQEQLEKVREETRKEMHKELLTSMHEDWRDVVAKPEFGVWLQTQPEDYRDKVNSTWNAFEVSKAIKSFKDHEASKVVKPAEKPNTRRDRLAAAVTPTGNAHAAPALDEEDAFAAGFKQVRGR